VQVTNENRSPEKESGFYFRLFSQTLLLLEVVDFRYRMLAFRGACGEPPWRYAPLGVSPVPLIPQESRTLHSNQLVNEENEKNDHKQQSFRKQPYVNTKLVYQSFFQGFSS
jgi:hypothetical protein